MLSIMGLYNYDPTIFDDLTVPQDADGNDLFDKATLIDTICYQNAELSLLYTDPATMKNMIRLWSNSSQYSWKTLGETMYFDYNPIWNKDGTIKDTYNTTDTGEGKVAAYNSNAYQPREYGENKKTGTVTREEQGNIGVTSTQHLIEEERGVAEFNIYDAISSDFKNRFCVMVY